MCPIFMKFDTQNKSNMLIINILIGINDFNPKLQICEIWSQKFGTHNKSNMLIVNIILAYV